MQIITFIFASSDVMVIHYCIWLEQKESVVTDFQGETHHPCHGYVDVIEVPMPDRAIKIGIFVLGATTNFGALSASSLQNEQNTKSIMSLSLLSMGLLGNRICFYCPFSWLKWIDMIYELKICAMLWSFNKSIPQNFSMNCVLHCFCLLHHPFINLPVVWKPWCVYLHC